MANANMKFKADLLPNTDLGYNLGDSSHRWKFVGDGTGITGISTQGLSRPKNLNGTNDVTIQTLINDNRANRLAFLPADQIIIEKTIDGGATWTDAGISDAVKTGLFSQTRPNVNIPTINGNKDTRCGLRITITAMKYNVPAGTAETSKYNYWNSDYIVSQERYNQIKEMYFWISSNNDAIKVKVERATGAASTNWSTCFENNNYAMTGWSGNDYISFSQGVFGGGTTQTSNWWNYRITFFTSGPDGGALTGNGPTNVQSISEIRAYGDTWWGKGTNMAATDHLYNWDANQNAIFPASVSAGSLVAPTLYIRATTSGSNSYTSSNPSIYFQNQGADQNIRLIYTDYDSVQSPSSLTLIGNQNTEYFIAPNIKATSKFYGNLSGNADSATAFSSAATITLTGDTTGTTSSTKSWSIATTTNQLSYKPQITTLTDLDAFGKSGLNMKIAKVSALDGHSGTLTKNDGIILAFPWSGGYGHQFYIDDNGYGLHHRYWYTHKVNDVDTVDFNNWVQIIDSNNYTNYTVTKTGSGASGNWDINITGNAASATKWQTARTLTIGNKGQTIDGTGNVTYNLQDIVIRSGNEFNYTADGISGLWFNYKTQGGTTATTKISSYTFGNGQGSSSGVSIIADSFSGNAATASKLGTTTVGGTDRPIYLNNGTATQTTYRMAGTNAAVTTARAITENLETGNWYVNGTNSTDLYSQSDGVAYVEKYNDSWIHEIYGDYRTGQIAVRGKNNGTWQAWRKILDSSNYTNYTVTKTGSGASGSWGINITGKAATAGTADKISNITTTDAASSSDTWRNVWISYSDNATGRPAYDTDLAYQTSTDTLKSSKYQLKNKARMEYNDTTNAIDFIFL